MRIVLIALLLLFAIHLCAQSRVVTGLLVDKETSKPIRKAIVSLNDANHTSTETNFRGYFQMKIDSTLSKPVLSVFHVAYNPIVFDVPRDKEFKASMGKIAWRLPAFNYLHMKVDSSWEHMFIKPYKEDFPAGTSNVSYKEGFKTLADKLLIAFATLPPIRNPVEVSFIVTDKGEVTDVVVDPDTLLSKNELIKIYQAVGGWQPAMQLGEPTSEKVAILHLFGLQAEFWTPEVPAEAKGGMKGLYRFLSASIHYPTLARRIGIEGKVFVTFAIDKDGKASDVKVIKGIGGGCDEEAIRVVSSFPPWSPATVHGKPVKTHYTIPIGFNLGNGTRK